MVFSGIIVKREHITSSIRGRKSVCVCVCVCVGGGSTMSTTDYIWGGGGEPDDDVIIPSFRLAIFGIT